MKDRPERKSLILAIIYLTNTVEGFRSIFKRGMKGVHWHCGKQHLHRYAAEFDFRYNNRTANGVANVERGQIALRSDVGKRLMYVRADEATKH